MIRPDPREIVLVGLPIMIEAVAVVLFVGMIAVWAAIGSATMSEAWSALIKPRLVVVSPEPSNQEAA